MIGNDDFDVVVLGGGMAGLTLAHHIAQQNNAHPLQQQKTLVLEPRTAYTRDKTWCYWQHTVSPFDEAITHRWSRWEVTYDGQTHVCEHSATAYARVDSARFYQIAQQGISENPNVSLHLGEAAISLTPHGTGVDITSDAGRFRANQVFDTRPKQMSANILLQHFVGWEIKTDTDVFDPSTVTLMDFMSGTNDIHFFYVLPFTSRHALVETTHFSKSVLCDEVYEEELSKYLKRRFGLDQWRQVHREQGVIPMPRQAPDLADRPHQNVIPMGLHSDTVKPSTGYCYPHAQQQAMQQARLLFADANAQATPARSRFNRWLDSVFIGFLEENPHRAGEIFFQLFSKVPADALVRFLSDRARPQDFIRVMTALPTGSFIKQAFCHAFHS